MYTRKMRFIVLGSSIGAVILFFGFIRQQFGVDNIRFLKSMIPHHSSAILMCEQGNVTDPEIKELCDGIVKTQLKEMTIMKNMLKSKSK